MSIEEVRIFRGYLNNLSSLILYTPRTQKIHKSHSIVAMRHKLRNCALWLSAYHLGIVGDPADMPY